jgi:hypothetical protein
MVATMMLLVFSLLVRIQAIQILTLAAVAARPPAKPSPKASYMVATIIRA